MFFLASLVEGEEVARRRNNGSGRIWGEKDGKIRGKEETRQIITNNSRYLKRQRQTDRSTDKHRNRSRKTRTEAETSRQKGGGRDRQTRRQTDR